MPFCDHCFARGSMKGLLVTGGMRDTNVGGNKERRHPDDDSIKTSFYVCIACGFRALDDPGLQFHLEGSWFCLESIMGKKQHTALRVLSPHSNNYPSSSNGGHSIATSNKVGVSPDTLFDYTAADDGIMFESINDQDQDCPIIQEPVADSKHDIDHTHERKESSSSPFSVADLVYLELATLCHDHGLPMKTYDESFVGPNMHSCVDITFPLMLPVMKLS